MGKVFEAPTFKLRPDCMAAAAVVDIWQKKPFVPAPFSFFKSTFPVSFLLSASDRDFAEPDQGKPELERRLQLPMGSGDSRGLSRRLWE